MKPLHKLPCLLLLLGFIYSCSSDTNHSTGNGAVMEGSNKDDAYQMGGYADSIPSDSVREAKRLDSIRIENSGHHNK